MKYVYSSSPIHFTWNHTNRVTIISTDSICRLLLPEMDMQIRIPPNPKPRQVWSCDLCKSPLPQTLIWYSFWEKWLKLLLGQPAILARGKRRGFSFFWKQKFVYKKCFFQKSRHRENVSASHVQMWKLAPPAFGVWCSSALWSKQQSCRLATLHTEFGKRPCVSEHAHILKGERCRCTLKILLPKKRVT